jgi:hypothetical protein
VLPGVLLSVLSDALHSPAQQVPVLAAATRRGWRSHPQAGQQEQDEEGRLVL